MSRPIRNNYVNTAPLKELMTAPPMTAVQHAQLMRERNQHRRMLEEAIELKAAIKDECFEDR